MYRSIICVLIIASLILCSTSIAFANPLDPWTSVQADRVTNGVVSIDNTLSNVYTGLTALYNYLKNNGDGVVEGLLILANRVSNIISTIDYYLPHINTNLQNIYSSLAAHSGSNLDLWGLTNSILTNTNALATGQLGIAQDINNIKSYVDGVESQLTSVNSNIQSLESINWIDFSNFTVKYSIDDINYYSDPSNVFKNSHTVYVKVYGVSTSNSLYYFNFPIFESLAYGYSMNVDVYYGTKYIYDNYYFYQNGQSCSILINPFFNIANSEQYAITFKFTNSNSSSNIFVRNGTTAKYITFDDTNYFNVASFIELSNNNKNTDLNDIKNILIDIDNNSDFIQNNNDLQINVDIDAADGRGVTAIISKLQDLFDFGVSLQEFLVTLNEFDNLHWFTSPETYNQVNQDPRFSPGYIDLYD